MLSLKIHAIITGALFAAMIVLAIAGNMLHDAGYIPDSSAAQIIAQVVFFSLFVLFGFSAIPLMLKLFIAGQIGIGNGDVAIVRALESHQTAIVIGVWFFLSVGLALAIPAAIAGGFFSTR